MGDTQNRQPYQTLGNHLRYLREQQMESVAEVSGAVEIDDKELERIELGIERPDEEILLLLISHFNMQDQEAGQLWELAGYHESLGSERRKQEELLQEALTGQKSVILVMGMDARTLYTDSSSVDTDGAGIVMNFAKLTKKQPQSVAKLGMSYEQAEQVLRQLQHALLHGKHNQQPKLLPPATDTDQV